MIKTLLLLLLSLNLGGCFSFTYDIPTSYNHEQLKEIKEEMKKITKILEENKIAQSTKHNK